MERLLMLLICFLVVSCGEKDPNNVRHSSDDRFLDLRKSADKLYGKRDYKFALIYYERLARLDSNNGENFYRKAICEAHFSLYNQSSKDFLKAIALNYHV